MYEGKIYIAPNYTLSHCKDVFFNLSASSTPEKWAEALDIFQDRMNARFFNGIEILSQYGEGEHWEHNLSFSIIALNCLLIETLQQFYDGLESTPPGQNGRAFSKFFRLSKHFDFSPDIASVFYKNVRNGILHQSETKGHIALSFSVFAPMVEITNGWVVFNVKRVSDALVNEFMDYIQRLRDPNEKELRSNFVTKMRSIVNKADDQDISTNRNRL